MAYMINDAVDFMCGSSGAGEGLDVGGGLSHAESSNEHNEEHLQTHKHHRQQQQPPFFSLPNVGNGNAYA